MAVAREIIILTRDTDQQLDEYTITDVNPTLLGASLQAAVQSFMDLTSNYYVTAYVVDKQIITDIP